MTPHVLCETTPGIASTKSVNAFPRTSKFGYWSKLAQAGDSSTTGSLAVDAPASRAAPSMAADSVPLISYGTLPSSVWAKSWAASPIR